MDMFNFNSDSYTNNEIESLLRLTPPYTINDINISKKRLIQQIGSINNLGNDKQQEIIDFVDKIAL